MRRLACLLCLALLAGCGRKETAPAPRQDRVSRPLAPDAPVSETQRRVATDAAEALNHYYALISAGDYDAAYRLRTPGRVDARRFAANFASYESYTALVGTPTVPVRAGNYIWVQLPVMITGRFKGGKPFGSSGNVVLRRPASGGGWQVVTDG